MTLPHREYAAELVSTRGWTSTKVNHSQPALGALHLPARPPTWENRTVNEPAQPDTVPITGTYSQCGICQAPLRNPFPTDWRLQVRVFTGVTLLTPHLPHCEVPR